jgi:uncharacterized protein YgbK (DUF1537 family)
VLELAASLNVRDDVALVVTGGETALHVFGAMGATAIHVTGEALPGIPLGVLELPQAQIAIATKSGGFGAPDALLKTAAMLRRAQTLPPASRD